MKRSRELETGPEQAGLSDEERRLARRFAEEVVDRRLTAAAVFFLEGMRPMNFILSQGMLFFSPLVNIVFDGATFDKIQEMLDKREAIPYIIELIEQLDEARRA